MALQFFIFGAAFLFSLTGVLAQDTAKRFSTDPYENEVKSLGYAMDWLRLKCHQLEAKDIDLEKEIANLTTQLIPALQAELEKAQQQILALTQEVANVTDIALSALNQSKTTSLDSTTHVAFSVYLTGGFFYPSSGDIIPFSGTTYNPNNDFSSSTNAFICPVSGVYYFGFSLYSAGIPSGSDDRIWVTMRLTGDIELSRAQCVNTDRNSYIQIQCSNSVVTQCDTRQSVWIQAEGSDNKIYGLSSYKTSTFSGFLLWKT